ncbi:uncharacterized protein [Malus domestica]|uniref:uncharacterized protein n=1 Tax=Malus domestica TaxID=3750 RepID=UPI0039766EA8
MRSAVSFKQVVGFAARGAGFLRHGGSKKMKEDIALEWWLSLDAFGLNAAGAGIVIIDPKRTHHCYSFLLNYQEATNNRAEYEALTIGLEILIELGATEVEVFGDSEFVINQLNGEYKSRHITMAGYYLATIQLLSYWGTKVSVNYIPREPNAIANEMAQLASGAQIQERKFEGDIEVQKRNLPSIFERGFSLDIMTEEIKIEDWKTPIIQYLNNPSFPT